MNEAEYRCETRILCRKVGCKKLICEDHRNQTKLASCLDQKEMITCTECEPALKEKARKMHFYFPGFIFMLINVCVWIPLIIGELTNLQEAQYLKRTALNLQYELNEGELSTLATAAEDAAIVSATTNASSTSETTNNK